MRPSLAYLEQIKILFILHSAVESNFRHPQPVELPIKFQK